MARKKNPQALARLAGFMLTNGEVERLTSAGFLPIIRWVKKSQAFYKRKKLYSTGQATAIVDMADEKERTSTEAKRFKVGDKVVVSDVNTVQRYRVGQRGTIKATDDVIYRIKLNDGDTLLLRLGEFSKDGA